MHYKSLISVQIHLVIIGITEEVVRAMVAFRPRSLPL